MSQKHYFVADYFSKLSLRNLNSMLNNLELKVICHYFAHQLLRQNQLVTPKPTCSDAQQIVQTDGFNDDIFVRSWLNLMVS